MAVRPGVVGSVKGAAQTIQNLHRFGAAMDKRLLQAAVEIAVKVQRTAVASIQRGPKTGRIYGKHQASAPGEAPATDTGALASSVQRVDDKKTTAAVGTGLGYGRDLEFGTKNMAARPWLFPALESERKAYIQKLNKLGIEAMKSIKRGEDK